MTLHVPRLRFALDPLIGEAKRRARHRRLLIAAGLLLATVAIGLTLGLRSGGGGPTGGLATAGASVRVGALRLSVPRGFRQYTVRGGSCNPGTRLPPIGLLLTDYPVKNGVGGAFCRWSDFKVPPPRRTALQVERVIPFGPAEPFTRLHLPLSLDQPWQIARAGNGTTGYRYGAFRLRGQIYVVSVWNGPSAPRSDRRALLRVLGSIRPTH
jgi:hypothetical protein